MCGNLEEVVLKMIITFEKYARKDGDGSTLSQDELCDLAVKEFPTLCRSTKKDDILKGILGSMDLDRDNKVCFKEFTVFIGCLAMAIRDQLSEGK
ncbi:protein S100-A2-like [Discoglossus pictus]